MANCHLVLTVLMAGGTLNGMLRMLYSIQQAFGRTKYILYVFVPSLLMYVPLLLLAAKMYGFVGAVAVFSVVSLIKDLVAIPITHRRLIPGEHWKWCWHDVGRPLIVLLLVGGLKFLVRWRVEGVSGLSTTLARFAAVLLGAALVTPISSMLVKYLRVGSKKQLAA